ncbi:MAG: hypothetical protein ACTS80_02025 [Candidatus Hodgkinia cicadicola]
MGCGISLNLQLVPQPHLRRCLRLTFKLELKTRKKFITVYTSQRRVSGGCSCFAVADRNERSLPSGTNTNFRRNVSGNSATEASNVWSLSVLRYRTLVVRFLIPFSSTSTEVNPSAVSLLKSNDRLRLHLFHFPYFRFLNRRKGLMILPPSVSVLFQVF